MYILSWALIILNAVLWGGKLRKRKGYGTAYTRSHSQFLLMFAMYTSLYTILFFLTQTEISIDNALLLGLLHCFIVGIVTIITARLTENFSKKKDVNTQ